jgi:hypothetical protein
MASGMSWKLNADRPLPTRKAFLARSRVWKRRRDVCRKKSEGKTTGPRTTRPCCVVWARKERRNVARLKCLSSKLFAVSKN